MTPTHSGEVQFVRWTDSSKGGPCVTFRLHDREELEAFIGMEGKRFMAALVGIADDETPLEPVKSNLVESHQVKTEDKPKGGALAKLAGQWCADPVFWEWLWASLDASSRAMSKSLKSEVTSPSPYTSSARAISEEWATSWVRHFCDIESRAELDHDPEAADKFHRLIREPYMQYLKSKR
jgi:hypothetical protein